MWRRTFSDAHPVSPAHLLLSIYFVDAYVFPPQCSSIELVGSTCRGFGLMDECVAGDTEAGKLVRVL